MGAERLRRLFAEVRGEGRTALLPFMTAGLPDVDSSAGIFGAMAEAGADAFEVGIPYSDPLMDGPVIQEAAARALAGGATIGRSMELVAAVAALGKPTLVMTYVNPVARIGPADFCRRAAEAGADGLIVADLPVEEAAPIMEAGASAGLGVVLFAAPTSDDRRLQTVADAGPVFIYGVAEMGVTGERDELSGRAEELSKRVRSITDLPLVLGVGISTPRQARSVAPLADGVIVGSALVRRVLEAGTPKEAVAAVGEAVAQLAAALR